MVKGLGLYQVLIGVGSNLNGTKTLELWTMEEICRKTKCMPHFNSLQNYLHNYRSNLKYSFSLRLFNVQYGCRGLFVRLFVVVLFILTVLLQVFRHLSLDSTLKVPLLFFCQVEIRTLAGPLQELYSFVLVILLQIICCVQDSCPGS